MVIFKDTPNDGGLELYPQTAGKFRRRMPKIQKTSTSIPKHPKTILIQNICIQTMFGTIYNKHADSQTHKHKQK